MNHRLKACNFHSIIVITKKEVERKENLKNGDGSIGEVIYLWDYRHRVIKVREIRKSIKGSFPSSNICFIFLHTQSNASLVFLVSNFHVNNTFRYSNFVNLFLKWDIFYQSGNQLTCEFSKECMKFASYDLIHEKLTMQHSKSTSRFMLHPFITSVFFSSFLTPPPCQTFCMKNIFN